MGCAPRWPSLGPPARRRSSPTSSRRWCRRYTRGDVVVRDNLKPHLAPGVAKSIEHAGARVLPLPPYRPDDIPIEAMSSRVKQWLRRAEARAKAELYDALGEALRQVNPRT